MHEKPTRISYLKIAVEITRTLGLGKTVVSKYLGELGFLARHISVAPELGYCASGDRQVDPQNLLASQFSGIYEF